MFTIKSFLFLLSSFFILLTRFVLVAFFVFSLDRRDSRFVKSDIPSEVLFNRSYILIDTYSKCFVLVNEGVVS